jgi:hypothetical protein
MGMDTQEPDNGSGKSSGASPDVPGTDRKASVDVGTGQEKTDEQDDGSGSTLPRLVERVTGLRCLNIGQGRTAQSTIRKRTERDLRLPDAEIPYLKTEKTVRDLVCSLLERQDRMNEAIFLKLNDLEYRFDDFELDRKQKGTKRLGAAKGGRK